ncbi:cytochrome c [Gammaproteobacteria bacterium]|nr:cytochrome c [Gammaproteobacteria bacterium]
MRTLISIGLFLLTTFFTTNVNAQTAVERGEQVFDTWCTACHDDTRRTPGTAALAAKYQGALPALLEERTDLTPAIIELWVRNGISIMPFFRKTEINDAQLADLGAYLTRNNGN